MTGHRVTGSPLAASPAAASPAEASPAEASPADARPRDASPVEASPAGARPELLRALGSVAVSPPPHCVPVMASLGLPAPTAAEHTGVFVLAAPPHAAIYLGEPGQLGGEALDRVAGFWRAIGLRPPPDADHLGALLMLYAELADAQAATHRETTRDRLRHAREALLFEHIWSWAPGYLTAVTRLGVPSLAAWARLLALTAAWPQRTFAAATVGRGRGKDDVRVAGLGPLAEARRAAPPAALPLALRTAPAPVGSAPGSSAAVSSAAEPGQMLDALLAPVRSGVLLTSADLRAAAAAAGLGYRVGERRYALRAMLDQDAAATLAWLSGHASRWAALHAAQQPVVGPDPRRWWARRAARTARTLQGAP